MTVAHLDFETRSAVDLKKAGVHRYAEDPSTGVWVARFRFDDGPVDEWRPGDEPPLDLLAHVAAGGEVVAHNAGFERTIWNSVLVRRMGLPWPRLKIEQQDCTMARAAAIALPDKLERLAVALKLSVQKDMEGHRLMMKMARPRQVKEDGTIIWWDEPANVDRLSAYCEKDVLVECGADKKVLRLSPSEKALWRLDQTINDRGVAIDVALVTRALDTVEEAKKRADRAMWRLTDGAVSRCTEVQKIVAWLNGRGVDCESVAKGEIEELIVRAQRLDDETAEEVIRLRRAAAKSSTSKFKAMLNAVCADGRVRGTLAYHGASTGRWAGRLIQPQNFPRVDPDLDLPEVELALDVLARDGLTPQRRCDLIELETGSAMETLSKALRAMIVAGPGKKFVGGDLSNIEGRINAWLASETWKIRAFSEFDRGQGPDLYTLAYSVAFGVRPDLVSKAERQIGKVSELALGYQGGVGAFQTMAATYGLRVADDRAEELKKAWRDAHPRIVQSWWDLQDAAIEATANPGCVVPVLEDRIRYKVDKGYLWCRLPSGRVLAYAAPRIVWTEVTRKDGTVMNKRQVEFEGVDSVTKRWGPQRLYGGLQCENIVQAVARDVIAEAMFRAEAEGFPIVLTVHDELLTEVSEDSLIHGADTLEDVMTAVPAWAEGLPLAAKAWEDKRYVK